MGVLGVRELVLVGGPPRQLQAPVRTHPREAKLGLHLRVATRVSRVLRIRS